MKQFFTIRRILFFLLFISCGITAYTAYYKVKYWGFALQPKKTTDIWIVDAHISFKAAGGPVSVYLSTPKNGLSFKVLNEDFIAKGYTLKQIPDSNRIELSSKYRKGKQDLYYRLTLYDNESAVGDVTSKKTPEIKQPIYDEQQLQTVEEIWAAASTLEGNNVQQIIKLFNQSPLNESVETLLPVKANLQTRAEHIQDLLALKQIPTRLVRGVKLIEGKNTSTADLMLEAFENETWHLYDLRTAAQGLPKNFVIFQRGNASLFDVEGGTHSQIRFSVLKSVTDSSAMAEHRAGVTSTAKYYTFSIYNLPLAEQNILKWLMVFPLGILVVVLMRNIVGVPTMGTFTPMLVAMSLVQTGFLAGLICFGIIITVGITLRAFLTRLNLLLVPRISSVVIFVILIIQFMAVIGHQYESQITSSAVYFPIIITAWVIERLSITWEEEGPKNALKETFWTMITAMATYSVIASETIRHFMFAFNEINLVILFVVMLLGTYTGYRLTELKRFYPLVKGK